MTPIVLKKTDWIVRFLAFVEDMSVDDMMYWLSREPVWARDSCSLAKYISKNVFRLSILVFFAFLIPFFLSAGLWTWLYFIFFHPGLIGSPFQFCAQIIGDFTGVVMLVEFFVAGAAVIILSSISIQKRFRRIPRFLSFRKIVSKAGGTSLIEFYDSVVYKFCRPIVLEEDFK